MVHRPTMIRDQDRVEIRLTREAEYRLPFTFIEALNEGTLFDRPAHVFRDAARQHRLFHVVNRTTENILGTGVVQLASTWSSATTSRTCLPCSSAFFRERTKWWRGFRRRPADNFLSLDDIASVCLWRANLR
jgi:hypothetical protein